MSATWDLVCADCLVALPLGKRVDLDDAGIKVEPRWGGFRNGWDGRRIDGTEHSDAVLRFLALHAGHTLVVLESDFLLELVADTPVELSPLTWISSVEEIEAVSLDGPSAGLARCGDAARRLSEVLSREVG